MLVEGLPGRIYETRCSPRQIDDEACGKPHGTTLRCWAFGGEANMTELRAAFDNVAVEMETMLNAHRLTR